MSCLALSSNPPKTKQSWISQSRSSFMAGNSLRDQGLEWREDIRTQPMYWSDHGGPVCQKWMWGWTMSNQSNLWKVICERVMVLWQHSTHNVQYSHISMRYENNMLLQNLHQQSVLYISNQSVKALWLFSECLARKPNHFKYLDPRHSVCYSPLMDTINMTNLCTLNHMLCS